MFCEHVHAFGGFRCKSALACFPQNNIYVFSDLYTSEFIQFTISSYLLSRLKKAKAQMLTSQIDKITSDNDEIPPTCVTQTRHSKTE